MTSEIEAPPNAESVGPDHFRRVMSEFPTGVVAITALQDGEPVGMTVGSFASLSLDPPLVGFGVGHSSTTWPKVSATGQFCVNVLADDQLGVARSLAGSRADKFADVEWTQDARGFVHLPGALTHIDCTIVESVPTGDHDFVIGRVARLTTATRVDSVSDDAGSPLLFFRSGFGRFSSGALSPGLSDGPWEAVVAFDHLRPLVESVANDLAVEVLVSTLDDGELALLGSCGARRVARGRLGHRMPFHAPLATPLALGSGQLNNEWIARSGMSVEDIAPGLQRFEDRGWSIALNTHELRVFERLVDETGKAPTVQRRQALDESARALAESMTAEKFEPDVMADGQTYEIREVSALISAQGFPRLVLSAYGLPRTMPGRDVLEIGKRIQSAAREAQRWLEEIGASESV